MEVIGLIAEYNPFHNGHLYQINKIKELFPDSIIILALNGYFLERGEVSIETKEEKTKLALQYGIDLVIELPFVFGSNSADTFAEGALELLNALGSTKLIFGSESNDIDLLTKIAKRQLEPHFDSLVKVYLKEGLNYPTALNKATHIPLNNPNDLLGVSYIKTILKHKYPIEPISIKRTNDYHDKTSNETIISASNIREKLKKGEDITSYIPEGKLSYYREETFFTLLKYKIITDDALERYLSVDEGIENKLKKEIGKVSNLEELISSIKTKRYTYNRIMRMFIHILIGLTKEDKGKLTKNEYIRLLGLNEEGQRHLNIIKKYCPLPIISKFSCIHSKIKDYELKAAQLYKILTGEDVVAFELSNKPILCKRKKELE